MSVEVEVTVECDECAAKIEYGEVVCKKCFTDTVDMVNELRDERDDPLDALNKKKEEIIDLETVIDQLRADLKAAATPSIVI